VRDFPRGEAHLSNQSSKPADSLHQFPVIVLMQINGAYTSEPRILARPERLCHVARRQTLLPSTRINLGNHLKTPLHTTRLHLLFRELWR
jgi:hypothetical protein